MTPLLQAFEARTEEVDAYFKFVELLEKETPHLSMPQKQTWKTRKVDEKVLRILKANCFLILYNLVEATIREGFDAIYKAIATDSTRVSKLTPQLLALWINHEFSQLAPTTANSDSYRQVTKKLVQSVVDDIQATLAIKTLNFGGNLDAARIRKLCESHGVPSNAPPSSKGGEKLLTVKSQRNALAHGDLSFMECGRDYTVAQLIEMKKQAVVYLRAILRNIDRYNAKKSFKI